MAAQCKMRVVILVATVLKFAAPLEYSFSAPVKRLPDKLSIITRDGLTQTINYSELPSDYSTRLITPHRDLNKDRIAAIWGGVTIRTLLKGIDLKKNHKERLSYICADSYTIQTTIGDAIDSNTFVATTKNGRTITLADGGPQLIIPFTARKDLEKYALDSWWGWNIASIVIGSPEPTLYLERSKDDKIKLSKRSLKKISQTVSAPPTYPVGMRLNDPGIQNSLSSTVDLSALLKEHGVTADTIHVYTINDRHEVIRSPFEDYIIIFQENGHNVAPSHGGPIKICNNKKSNGCIFFVRSISTHAPSNK